jgi:hypothetical protein
MNRFRPPSLKLPDVKVPAFLKDVYYDLRDRRLLPLVALIVVAILAVPILLGESADDPAEPEVAPLVGAGGATASKLTVVRSNPGLRDYHRRLAGRSPTDPFVQKYTQVDLSGAKLNPQTQSGGGAPDGTTVTTTVTDEDGGGTVEADVTVDSDPGNSGGGTPPKSSGPPKKDGDDADDGLDGKNLTFYAFAIDVKIAKTAPGKGEKQEPVLKERVLPLTALPGEKTPVVTYMGSSKKGRPLLMVATDVRSVFGDVRCASGEDVCQLLEVEPGFPVTFVYGAGETRYRINVLKIEPVVTGRK